MVEFAAPLPVPIGARHGTNYHGTPLMGTARVPLCRRAVASASVAAARKAALLRVAMRIDVMLRNCVLGSGPSLPPTPHPTSSASDDARPASSAFPPRAHGVPPPRRNEAPPPRHKSPLGKQAARRSAEMEPPPNGGARRLREGWRRGRGGGFGPRASGPPASRQRSHHRGRLQVGGG